MTIVKIIYRFLLNSKAMVDDREINTIALIDSKVLNSSKCRAAATFLLTFADAVLQMPLNQIPISIPFQSYLL